jgi:hypothetical protein
MSGVSIQALSKSSSPADYSLKPTKCSLGLGNITRNPLRQTRALQLFHRDTIRNDKPTPEQS